MLGVALGAVVLAHVITVMACAQLPSSLGSQGDIFREIDDPHTGDRWLLMRDDSAPGGPGRLVLVASQRSAAAGELDSSARHLSEANQSHEARPLPVIRAGDSLIVEEHTAIADARLEARALSPAAPGSTLKVRLSIGGKVMRAVALGPGRAALQAEPGERP